MDVLINTRNYDNVATGCLHMSWLKQIENYASVRYVGKNFDTEEDVLKRKYDVVIVYLMKNFTLRQYHPLKQG